MYQLSVGLVWIKKSWNLFVQCYQHARESNHCCVHDKGYMISLLFYDAPPCSASLICIFSDLATWHSVIRTYALTKEPTLWYTVFLHWLYSWLKKFLLLWNLNFHHNIHKSPPLDHLSLFYLVFIFTTHSSKIHFNTFTSMLPSGDLNVLYQPFFIVGLCLTWVEKPKYLRNHSK